MPLHVATRADDGDKHEFDVTQIIFQKGKLYTCADDGKIKMWAPDLKFLKEVRAHRCSIYSITASDDTLFSCSNDGTVKSWELGTLRQKKVFLEDREVEFWKVKYYKGVLYIGDDQGNVRIYKNGKFNGSINFAVPVKDLALRDNLVFASKDNDVIITDLDLQGEKPHFGVKPTFMGRGPLALVDDKLIFMSRDGMDIIVNVIGHQHYLKEIARVTGAHNMIINGATAVNWEGGDSLLFTGGWDKVIKQWKIEKNSLKSNATCRIDFTINSMAYGEKNQIYVAGGDGHIARLDL